MTKLTIKQERFCNKYLECGTASEAYRYAYSCEKMKDKTIRRKALEMMENGIITAYIAELQSKLQAKSDITKERNLKELANIAYSSIASFHKTWVDLKDFDELTDEQKSCIKSIQTRSKTIGIAGEAVPVEATEIKIELFDRLKAIDMINKMLGFDAPIKQELSGVGGIPLMPANILDLSTLTEAQLRDMLAVAKSQNKTE